MLSRIANTRILIQASPLQNGDALDFASLNLGGLGAHALRCRTGMDIKPHACKAPKKQTQTNNYNTGKNMNTKQTTQTKPNTFVRFKTPEYQLITEDSQKTNLSIPTLLKKSYFSKRHQFKLINTEEIKPIIFHLSKIGNNMNQIAKQLNAGIRNGFNTEYDNMADEFRKVQQILVTVYGLR